MSRSPLRRMRSILLGEIWLQRSPGKYREHIGRTMSYYPQRAEKSIQSLHPGRLLPSDYVDFSGIVRAYVRNGLLRGEATNFFFAWDKSIPIPFPSWSRGFLYYHRPKSGPDIAGEMRFRITESNDPSTFPRGHDLLSGMGLPWRIPIIIISMLKRHAGLVHLLRRDGLVSSELVNHCHGLHQGISFRTSSRFLYTLDTVFHVEFHRHCWVHLILEDGISREVVRFPSPSKYVKTFGRLFPYECSALCRFERQEGSKGIALRILKILKEPICRIPEFNQYILPPVEGELLLDGRASPWKVHKRLQKALQSLPIEEPV